MKKANFTVIADCVSIKTACPYCGNEIELNPPYNVPIADVLNGDRSMFCANCGGEFEKDKVDTKVNLW